jgi:Delta3-Delta2-enoyl-CoA isomerase
MSAIAGQRPELPSLEHDVGIYIIRLGDGEQKFSPDFVEALTRHLRRVAADDEARAMITVADGKFWSFGLDLDWMAEHPDQIGDHLLALHELCARLLELPVISVAAIQGHAFAAGALLALAHDFRVMRRDRGYFCLPEVDLQIAFTPGLARLVKARLPAQAAHEAVLSGRRYGGADAEAAGIVDEAVDEQDVYPRARELALELGGKPRHTLVQIREVFDADVVAALRDAEANRTNAEHFAAVLRRNNEPRR